MIIDIEADSGPISILATAIAYMRHYMADAAPERTIIGTATANAMQIMVTCDRDTHDILVRDWVQMLKAASRPPAP